MIYNRGNISRVIVYCKTNYWQEKKKTVSSSKIELDRRPCRPIKISVVKTENILKVVRKREECVK